MKRRLPGYRSWAVAGLLALAALAPRTASAQEWYEHYAGGVEALRAGQPRQAVDQLRRAVQKRPEPGTAVPTYGTNFEPRYFPYLRLAEALLQLDAPEEAHRALETSARLGKEPAGERAALEARVRAAIEAKRPAPAPPPTLPAEPAPKPAAVAPAIAPAAPPPVPTPTPTPAPTIAPTPRGPTAVETPARTARRELLAQLEITSDPPAAEVFLDDARVGSTDPRTGLLRILAVPAGHHRLRLSLAGHDDLVRELEIRGESHAFAGVLPRSPVATVPAPPAAPSSPAAPMATPLAPWTAVALVLLALAAGGLWLHSLARTPPRRAETARTPMSTGGRRDSGTGEVLPMAFGEYSLLARLGKGGMAVVYEAEKRGEIFALKRPLAGFVEDERFRERFVREAELGRTLHHPNIVRIVDRGQVVDVPYFAMELVRGETLRQCLDREGRLDAAFAARLTAQVAEALDYAHNKGVIHRDLKPSNIMLDAAGSAKVMDYGIARARHLEGLTTTGSFLGTPSYAAPETVDAVSQPASDIYSLGVVFFEMLTGSLPFQGDSALAMMRGHCTTPPPAPSSLNYTLSAGLDAIVLRLLTKEPGERPTAEQLLNELADFLAERP